MTAREPRLSAWRWARSGCPKTQSFARAAGSGFPRTDSRTGALAAGCRGDRRGLLLGERQVGSEAGPGARRGAAGGGAAGIARGRIRAPQDQVQRGGLRAGEERAGAVHGGAAAEPGRGAGAGRRSRCAGHRHLPHSYRADAGSARGWAMHGDRQEDCRLAVGCLLALAAPGAPRAAKAFLADPVSRWIFPIPACRPRNGR